MVTQPIHVDVGSHRATAPVQVTVGGGTGVLHGRDIHAGNVGVVGAGLSYSALAPIGDTHLKPSWLSANADGDRIWHGPCEQKAAAHWHFERWAVAGRISVSLDDMHVRWCRVSTTGPYPLRFFGTTAWDADYVGLIAEWLEIAGPPSTSFGVVLQGQRPGSAIVRRCHVHHQGIGALLRPGNTFVNCLVEDIHYTSGSHNTCMSTRGGSSGGGWQVVGCRLMGGNSAALSMYTDQGAVQDVEVRDCYLTPDEGTNYGAYCGEDTSTGNYVDNRDIRWTGNVFGRDNERWCGSSGPRTQWNGARPGAVWSGNTWGPRGPHWQEGDPEQGDPVG